MHYVRYVRYVRYVPYVRIIGHAGMHETFVFVDSLI